MKKLIFCFACLAISITTFSQVKIRPGVRIGLNSSTVSNVENASRKLGVNGAIFLNIHFARFYELQPELTYSNQGYSQDDYFYRHPYSGQQIHINGRDLNTQYIGMSIANKFFIVPNSSFHLIIGPSLEIKAFDDSYIGEIIPIDISLFGGIGYEFPMGLGIEARYKHGLIDVRDGYYDGYYNNGYYDDDNYYSGNNWLNSVFQFNVYYKFDFSK